MTLTAAPRLHDGHHTLVITTEDAIGNATSSTWSVTVQGGDADHAADPRDRHEDDVDQLPGVGEDRRLRRHPGFHGEVRCRTANTAVITVLGRVRWKPAVQRDHGRVPHHVQRSHE